jgi:glucose-1-phosphate adenylyltransferase
VVPDLNMYDKDWPIWTYQEQLPPAKFVFDEDERRGKAVDSLVSGGCIISGACVKQSLLFSDVRVNSYSNVEGSVILPKVSIGRYATVIRAVIDKGCVIPDGMQIGVNHDEDRKRFYVSEKGITLVTPEMLGQSIHHSR